MRSTVSLKLNGVSRLHYVTRRALSLYIHITITQITGLTIAVVDCFVTLKVQSPRQ